MCVSVCVLVFNRLGFILHCFVLPNSLNSKYLFSYLLVKLSTSVKATILNEDKINDLCTTWKAESEKAAELLPNMTAAIESTRNAFNTYKTERLADMKTNIVDKFANDIEAARASYAINGETTESKD